MLRLALLLSGVIACAPVPAAAPVVHAQADAPHPGPCVTEEVGPEGHIVVTYAYGPRDRIVREVERGEARHVQRLWSYDEAGRRVRQIVIESDRLHAVWYVYDDHGLLVAVEEDATGKRDVVLRRERDYDERGRLVRLATTRPDGEITEEQTLHYDAKGRLALELVARGDASDRIEIEVDPAGRIVARRGQHEAQRFAYSTTGRLEQMTVDHAGIPHRVHRYRYDDAGNLLTTETLDAAGRMLRSTRHSYACW